VKNSLSVPLTLLIPSGFLAGTAISTVLRWFCQEIQML